MMFSRSLVQLPSLRFLEDNLEIISSMRVTHCSLTTILFSDYAAVLSVNLIFFRESPLLPRLLRLYVLFSMLSEESDSDSPFSSKSSKLRGIRWPSPCL